MSTADRELLELAAKAAGVHVSPMGAGKLGLWIVRDLPRGQDDQTIWNPLTDDGDALRLAVKLGLQVQFFAPQNTAFVTHPRHDVEADDLVGFDPYAAARRAITRAAAEIGKAMK